MPIPEIVLLLNNDETARALKLTMDDLEWLVATNQLSPIFIRSERRFLLADVEALIRTYRTVQQRN